MDEAKLESIISNLQSEIESIRNRINSSESVVCTHTICDACHQRNLEVNAEKELLTTQLREKETIIQKLQE